MSETGDIESGTLGRRALAAMVVVSCMMSGCIFGSGETPGGSDPDTSTSDVQDVSDNDVAMDVDVEDVSDVTDADDVDARDASDGEDTSDATDADATDADATDADTTIGPEDCTEQQTFCSGQCVDTSSNVNHCGECESACEFLAGTAVACRDESCVYECMADRSDLNEDLNTEGSDGCEGECAEANVGTYYTDIDQDSYGNPSTARRLCSSEADASLATRGGDCQDQNEDVKPTAGFFETPRSDGSWDYNCSGSDEKEFPSEGECSDPLLVGSCSFTSGWEGDVPDCGESGSFYTGCCGGATTESRTQKCR